MADVVATGFLGLLGLLAAVVLLRVLRGDIRMSGLLTSEQDGQIEPERLQAVAVAVAVPILYALDVQQAAGAIETLTKLPPVPEWMLIVTGASQSLYIGGKIGRGIANPA